MENVYNCYDAEKNQTQENIHNAENIPQLLLREML
jgi:hypothetical protein